jgi:hypothetical protein
MSKQSKVTLVGTPALTITEARALIQAALQGRYSLMPGDVAKVEHACEKVAEGLVAAGQDRSLVQSLFNQGF